MNGNLKVYSNSIHTGRLGSIDADITCFMVRDVNTGDLFLGVRESNNAQKNPFTEPLFSKDGDQFYALNSENALLMRQIFPWLNPVPIVSSAGGTDIPSFGFGDRLGMATSGHIAALKEISSAGSIFPIFAQQSVRENMRTGRTPQQVMDDAMWGVYKEGWQGPWGGDADHLKQVSDLPAFVQAGYTFFTIDPGEHVDPAADEDDDQVLIAKAAAQNWNEIEANPVHQDELAARFQSFCGQVGWTCQETEIKREALRAIVKYGRAVIHITKMFRALQLLKPGEFDFEVSVDETETPTSPLEHFYIASELRRLGVRFNSLAPRFPGRFEKGVDYIGDLNLLETEMMQHVSVMREFGGYRLSLHSGSDKFSVYPLLVRYGGKSVHVKTAGTSYLEALRVVSVLDPLLFRQILKLARDRYTTDRLTYHVSANEELVPSPDSIQDQALLGLLDDFHARQMLHVTFGSALAQFGPRLKEVIKTNPETYDEALRKHFRRHLAAFR